MSPFLDPSRLPAWLRQRFGSGHARGDRALTVVLGIIGVSLVFVAFEVTDVAVSGALHRFHRVRPVAEAGPSYTEVGCDAGQDGAPMDAVFIEVPQASAEAVSL